MKIGIVQSAFGRCGDFSQQMKCLATHGFEAVDFQDLILYKSALYALSPAAFEATLKEYEQIAREEGVEISQVHGPYTVPQADTTPEAVDIKRRLTFRAIEGTAMLDCRKLVVHPLFPNTSHDLSHAEETREANLRFLYQVCQKAKEYGVWICLENMPSLRFSLATVPDVLGIVKELNDPQLRVCLDTGHCSYFECSPAKAVRQIGGELLGALHIHDNNGREDQHRLPYDGIIDWADFAHALAEVDFDGALSLETGVQTRLPEPLFDDYMHHVYRRTAYLAEMVRSAKSERNV